LRSTTESDAVTHQKPAETFLRQHSGHFFCAACLAHALGVSRANVRTLLWTLRRLRVYEISDGRYCMRCLRRRRVIRHVDAGAMGAAGAGDIIIFLLANAGTSVCDACLAFATNRRFREVKNVLTQLKPFEEFRRDERMCMVCSCVKAVISAGIDEGDVASETEVYRTARLELLSYEVSGGWRPFVLIKDTPASLIDAPSVLDAVLPSKSEANRHAAHVAKRWLDTQGPF
jgi:hypothetical protein